MIPNPLPTLNASTASGGKKAAAAMKMLVPKAYTKPPNIVPMTGAALFVGVPSPSSGLGSVDMRYARAVDNVQMAVLTL